MSVPEIMAHWDWGLGAWGSGFPFRPTIPSPDGMGQEKLGQDARPPCTASSAWRYRTHYILAMPSVDLERVCTEKSVI